MCSLLERYFPFCRKPKFSMCIEIREMWLPPLPINAGALRIRDKEPGGIVT